MSKKAKWIAALAIPIMYVAYACTQKDPHGAVMLWSSFWEVCALNILCKERDNDTYLQKNVAWKKKLTFMSYRNESSKRRKA